jgi:hypothetical protein
VLESVLRVSKELVTQSVKAMARELMLLQELGCSKLITCEQRRL